MPIKLLSLWGILYFLSARCVWAQETKKTSCQVTSYVELVHCAEKGSKEIQLYDQQVLSADKLEEKAKQWTSPELTTESLWKGSDQSEFAATLLFTIPLGGKRTALMAEAKSTKEKNQSQRDLSFQQKRLEFMLGLFRLTHLKVEIALEEESIQTFQKVVTQFETKPVRTPEQDVSLSIFKMAIADHKLKLTTLKINSEQLIENLEVTSGVLKSLIVRNLPAKKEKWPEIKLTTDLESAPQIRQAAAELKLAKSLKDKADSDAYPDIKLGPSFRSTKDSTNDANNYIGLSLTLPLPVLSTNSGERAFQKQKVQEAELALSLTKQKEDMKRSLLIKQYQQKVQSLKDSPNMKTLMEKHEQIEKQFFKGLVSSSLVIEAHRQLYDLQERQNQSELEALESYGQILILDNQFYEVIL